MIAEPFVPRARAAALLVDGENLPCTLAPALVRTAARLGAVSIARVYGDARKLNGWADTPGFRLVHAHAGKNVTDILLAVEAMELACEGRIDALALATRDRDFAPLALALRARGLPVLAITAGPAPAHLVAACTAHVALAEPKAQVGVATVKPALVAAPLATLVPETSPPDPLAALRRILSQADLSLTDFGKEMRAAGVNKPTSRNWASFLSKHSSAFEIVGTGPTATIRLRKR